jgi:hypothetical protein
VGHKFSIPKTLVDLYEKEKFAESSGVTIIVVDQFLVQMFKEMNAEKEFLATLSINCENPDVSKDESSKTPEATLDDVHSTGLMIIHA